MNKILYFLKVMLILLPIGAMSDVDPDGTKMVSKFLSSVGDRMLAAQQSTKSEGEKDNVVILIFQDVVDSAWMAKFVLGPLWQNLGDAQREQYTKAYRDYLLKIYMPKFKQYHAASYKIINVQSLGNEQFMTSVVIAQTDAKPSINIKYRLQCTHDVCQFRDIIAEEISLISSQRSDFASVVTNQGFDQLLKLLQSK